MEHLAQSPCSHRVSYSILIRNMSRWLWISPGKESPQPHLTTYSIAPFHVPVKLPVVPISAHCFSSCYSSPRRALVLPLDVLPPNTSDVDKIPFQSALLQAKQSWLPQAFFMNEALQYPPHLHCLPLDLLQELHVFLVLRSSEQVTALQRQTHQGWIEQQDHSLWPPGYIP